MPLTARIALSLSTRSASLSKRWPLSDASILLQTEPREKARRAALTALSVSACQDRRRKNKGIEVNSINLSHITGFRSVINKRIVQQCYSGLYRFDLFIHFYPFTRYITLSASWISQICSPVAGLYTGNILPLSEFCHSLLIKI